MTAEREEHARGLLRWIYEVSPIDARGDELISWLTFAMSQQKVDMRLIQSIATLTFFTDFSLSKPFQYSEDNFFFKENKHFHLWFSLLLHIDRFMEQDCNGSTSRRLKA